MNLEYELTFIYGRANGKNNFIPSIQMKRDAAVKIETGTVCPSMTMLSVLFCNIVHN